MNGQTKVNRRQFLIWVGGGIAASALACGGLGTLATRPPEIEFVESSCGKEENMEDKILVAYASRAGSTCGVAEAVGEAWCNGGATVDVRLAKDVSNMSPYNLHGPLEVEGNHFEATVSRRRDLAFNLSQSRCFWPLSIEIIERVTTRHQPMARGSGAIAEGAANTLAL